MPETTTKPTANSEQLADLAALQASANESDQVNAPGQSVQSGPQPPSASALQLAAMAVQVIKPLATAAVPALRGSPDELWAPIPEGLAAILDHYGWNRPDLLDSPWAKLALSLAPLAAYAAMESMKDDKPKARPKAAAISEAPGADSGPKTVTVGAVMPAAAE